MSKIKLLFKRFSVGNTKINSLSFNQSRLTAILGIRKLYEVR